ncbi:MAG: hypothetical protein KKA79_07660 [Nanoarchaeota archaeon]|nr:hypothetical protein [Nanoarchaeota archaeon]MCG2717279.1 hypothetical protein [Nanoarchaeota archaeon]
MGGFFEKLITCAAIGIALSPYYWYASKNEIAYKDHKRPALVENIDPQKLEPQSLEDKLKAYKSDETFIEKYTPGIPSYNNEIIKQDIESPYQNQTIITSKKSAPDEILRNEKPRYRIIEDKDFFLFKWIGYVGSLPFKALFMDSDINNYVKPETKKSIERLLEADNKIDGLTVRLNHTHPLQDTWRLFTDKDLRERNNFFARLILGFPSTFLGELSAKFVRCDYYNPYTKVATMYSNVEGVAKHELGHHRDFMRFDRDWLYSLSRILPPVMLYQEWKATKYAKWTLEEKNRTDFGRFLVPAYATYVAITLLGIYKFFRKREDE